MRRQGFTLVEVSLAIAIGLAVMAASYFGFQQIQQAARMAKAKTMVGTIQTNIAMEKFRTGTPPTLAALQANVDSAGKPYWSESGTFPTDPIGNDATITPFASASAAVPLAAGAPSPQWDNPIFQNAAMGNGGWLYDASTGAFRIDYSNQKYPDQRPGNW